jgi:hypothetical protein
MNAFLSPLTHVDLAKVPNTTEHGALGSPTWHFTCSEIDPQAGYQIGRVAVHSADQYGRNLEGKMHGIDQQVMDLVPSETTLLETLYTQNGFHQAASLRLAKMEGSPQRPPRHHSLFESALC